MKFAAWYASLGVGWGGGGNAFQEAPLHPSWHSLGLPLPCPELRSPGYSVALAELRRRNLGVLSPPRTAVHEITCCLHTIAMRSGAFGKAQGLKGQRRPNRNNRKE